MLTPVFNPVATSGAGFQLEHYVQASYLASLVLKTPLPLRDGLLVEQLVFQGKHLADTDDLIVHLAGSRLQKQFIQSKHGFEINANPTFFEVIENCWRDYHKGYFTPGTDQFIITTQALTKADAADGLVLLEWARFSHSAADFRQKVGLNKKKQAKLHFFQQALAKANRGSLDDETEWAFLKSFFIRTFDYMESGSRDKEILKWYLEPFIKSPTTAEHILSVLLTYVAECNQHGAAVTAHSVPPRIRELFDLQKTESVGPELKGLLRKSFSALNDTIHTDIDGFHLERSRELGELVELAEQHDIVFIIGEPGAGKSALQKNYLLQTFNGAPEFLFLKADTLDRSSLSQTLAEVGVHQDFQTIAAQWCLLPKLILCIDGFEKLYESEHTGAFLELLETIKRGNGIKLIATCRAYALSTLLQKYRINRSTCGILELPVLTGEELQTVVRAKPRLAEVVSNPKLKKLVNKPFYLDMAIRVLESLPAGTGITAQALKEALWEHVVERRGHSGLGTARKRAKTFSRLVLKRAAERRAFVQQEPDMKEDILEKLVQDELLTEGGGMNGYAPRHDILEDMVVIRDLRERYQHKDNTRSFLASLDTSPVYRRGLRLWLQETLAEGSNVKALADALDLVNVAQLSGSYHAYLVRILALAASLKDLDAYEYISFKHRLGDILARYLVSTSDKPAQSLLLRILLLSKKHFSFVIDTLKSLVAHGHDEGYPESLWDHLEMLFDYGRTEDARTGFFLMILFASISNPERCRKLPVAGKGRQLHERVVTELSGEAGLTAAIFKLLRGIGSTYQPVCLSWLMKGMPGEAELTHCLGTPAAVQEAEAFVAKIQINHLTYLRRNRDQFDYLLLLLNVLVARGSKAAFQIREQIL